MITVDLLLIAKKIDNYVIGGASFSDSQQLHKVTCPANKRWFVLGGQTYRDVAATLKVTIKDSSNQELIQFAEDGAGAIEYTWPNSEVVPAAQPSTGLIKWVMDAGDYVEFAFDVNQTAAARLSCVVLEIPRNAW